MKPEPKQRKLNTEWSWTKAESQRRRSRSDLTKPNHLTTTPRWSPSQDDLQAGQDTLVEDFEGMAPEKLSWSLISVDESGCGRNILVVKVESSPDESLGDETKEKAMTQEQFVTIRERMLKIKELADRGEAGERDVALKMLQKQLDKYGITIDQLVTQEEKHLVWFGINSKAEREIVFGVYRKITDAHDISYYKRKEWGWIGLYLTTAEEIEMNELVKLFTKQYYKERDEMLARLETAFINKHRLFSSTPVDSDEPSQYTKEEIRKIVAMMHNLDDVELPHKKLNAHK